MKFIRFIASWLLFALILAAILIGAAFIPTVQTWVAQWAFDRQTLVQGSFDSVSATLGQVEVDDVHLTKGGANLTLPSVQIGVPLISTLRQHRLAVRSLTAKGWTLDLRPNATAVRSTHGAVADPGRTAAGAVLAVLKGWALPWDTTVDQVDLEGDVLLPDASSASQKVHVVLKGGGIAAGRTATLSLEAASSVLASDFTTTSLNAKGQLLLTLDTPRTLGRAEFKADVTAKGNLFPLGRTITTDLSAVRAGGQVSYAIDLSLGKRHLITAQIRRGSNNRFFGGWQMDLTDAEVTPFTGDRRLPTFGIRGEGRFDADEKLSQIHTRGRLRVGAGGLEAISPQLAHLGLVNLACDFDATGGATSIHVERLVGTLSASKPIATVTVLRPFDYDWKQESFKAPESADWMDIQIRSLPMDWLQQGPWGLEFSGGDLSGRLVLRSQGDGFVATAKAPLTATGVTIKRGATVIGHDLDLSANASFEVATDHWQAKISPLVVTSAGRSLATLEGTLTRAAGEDQPEAVTAAWKADLEAIAAANEVPKGVLLGKSASGDFTASIGYPTVFEGKVLVTGQDESHTLEGTFHASIDGYGRISFSAPIKIAQGRFGSDLSVEGSVSRDGDAPRFVLQASGDNVHIEDLMPVAACLAAAGGAPLAFSGEHASSEVRDKVAFWGNWTGTLTATFTQFHAAGRDFRDVGGAFLLDHDSIKLERGRFTATQRGKRIIPAFTGLLTFDPAAAFPYSLSGTVDVDRVEFASVFGKLKPHEDPPMEGPFSIAGTVEGKGINPMDLTRRTREHFKFESKAAIVRLFGTEVDQMISIPDKTSVSDVVGSVGSAVGGFFGLNKSDRTPGANHLSKPMEAVLNFNNQVTEIGCDDLSFTATRDFDGAIHVGDIALVSTDLKVSGTADVAASTTLPLNARPLNADLHLSVNGGLKDLLATAKLLTPPKDKKDYADLPDPVHLGGTLAHIDRSAWAKLLLQAATQPAEIKK